MVVLNFLLAHSSYVSLGALVMSVFFAGTMLQGERVRQQEVKAELREIEQVAAQSMNRVAQINAQLEAEDARLVEEIGETYAELAALNEKERQQRAELEATAARNRQLDNQRNQQRTTIERSAGFIIDN